MTDSEKYKKIFLNFNLGINRKKSVTNLQSKLQKITKRSKIIN